MHVHVYFCQCFTVLTYAVFVYYHLFLNCLFVFLFFFFFFFFLVDFASCLPAVLRVVKHVYSERKQLEKILKSISARQQDRVG